MPQPITAIALALTLLLAIAGCSSKKEADIEKAKEPTTETSPKAGTDDDAAAELAADTDAQEPEQPGVQLAEVSPVTPPADWPVLTKVDEIPQDLFDEVLTKSPDGRPSVFTLKKDVVMQQYPCQAGKRISVFVNGDALAACTLAIDFTVAKGVDLAQGTEIKTQPTGGFAGFVLKAPQMVRGVPVAPNQIVYWTKSSGLGSVTLADKANVLGIQFNAGTQVAFRSDSSMLSLQWAKLEGEHVIGGQTYASGLRIEFDQDNKVVTSE